MATTPEAVRQASRSRVVLVCALAAVVVLGLLSRRYPLPGVLAEHTGDALYTIAAFVALALCRPAWSGRWLALLAWLLSVVVEVSQLSQWQWLIDVRSTRLGGLLMGQGWQWADLVAYAIGAVVAFATDAALRRSRTTRK